MLTLDDEVLNRAHARALEQGTSVERPRARLRFEGLAEESRAETAILEIAARSSAGSGPGGRSWTPDELYDR
jgi:hypothetical protein